MIFNSKKILTVEGKAHILYLLQLNPKVRLADGMTENYNSYTVILVYMLFELDSSEECVPLRMYSYFVSNIQNADK